MSAHNGSGYRNGNGNGNGKTALAGNVAKESFGFLVAEAAGMATSLGVVAVAEELIPRSLMKNVTHTVSKVCVEPYLDTWERGVASVCKLEECKADPDKPREQRAENLARMLILCGAATVLSIQAKLHTRRFMNNLVGVHEPLPPPLRKSATTWEKVKHYGTFSHLSPQERMIFFADEGVHLGALFMVNNPLSDVTDDMIRATSGIIQKSTGVSEKKAREVSTMCWLWEVPNVLGTVAGILAVTAKHTLDWPKPGWFGRVAAGQEAAQQLTSLPPHK